MATAVNLLRGLQLSLFGDPAASPATLREPAPPPPAAPQRPPAKPPAPASPSVRVGGADDASASSQRRLATPAGEIVYTLRRSRRRTIGISVGEGGVSVAAARWVALRDIDAFVAEKASWIQRKLAEHAERRERLDTQRIEWREGGELPFLGQRVRITLDARTTGALLEPAVPQAEGGEAIALLRLGLPADATPERIREAVQCWLQRQAKRVFEARTAHYAAQLGVRVKRLSLSSAQTRWGSASADGSVWLNWRLIHFSEAIIDYVVAHELAHLKEMNHSPAFWRVVGSVVPDYPERRTQLRQAVVPPMEA